MQFCQKRNDRIMLNACKYLIKIVYDGQGALIVVSKIINLRILRRVTFLWFRSFTWFSSFGRLCRGQRGNVLLRIKANNFCNACCDWNPTVSVCFGPNCCNSKLYAKINVKSKICKTRINFHDALKWGPQYNTPPRQTQDEKISRDSQ